MKTKEIVFKILNGMSLGIVIALIPGAMFNEIAKLLSLTTISSFLALSTSLACLIIGLCIAMQFKFDPISSATLAITTMIAGGAFNFTDGKLMLTGSTGDVLNAALGAFIAILIIINLQNRLKAYKLIILPLLVIVVVGTISTWTLPYSTKFTLLIGDFVNLFTTMQPLVMSVLLALFFGLLIVSPISTVAVAVAINLVGGGSAAANIGITGVALSLAILSFSTNGLGTSLAHFLGSPKIQMANFIKRPIMILPGLVSGMMASISVPFLNLVGTSKSAGFGLSGLIGPLGHLNTTGFDTKNIILVIIGFIIIPTITSFISVYLFKSKLKLVKDEDYRLSI